MNEQSTFVYYTAQAANRRHFQQLFFAVTGFTWSFALALFAVLEPQTGNLSLLASGLTLVGGAFIAHRLLKRERSSFAEMIAAWHSIFPLKPVVGSASAMPGAMAIACGAQAVLGMALIAAAIIV